MTNVDNLHKIDFFAGKNVVHIHGSDDSFIAFAHKPGDYSLRISELSKLDWYYYKFENDNNRALFSERLGIPLTLESYPYDIAYTYSDNVSAFCSPIPLDFTINAWINQLFNFNNVSTIGQFGLPTKFISCLAITLWINRDKRALLDARDKNLSLREFFDYHTNTLNFILEQRRPIWDFGV